MSTIEQSILQKRDPYIFGRSCLAYEYGFNACRAAMQRAISEERVGFVVLSAALERRGFENRPSLFLPRHDADSTKGFYRAIGRDVNGWEAANRRLQEQQLPLKAEFVAYDEVDDFVRAQAFEPLDTVPMPGGIVRIIPV